MFFTRLFDKIENFLKVEIFAKWFEDFFKPAGDFGLGLISSSITGSFKESADKYRRAAQPILDLIAKHEGAGSYNIVYGGAAVPLTQMTIREVRQYQDLMLRSGSRSSAVGRYQFIKSTFAQVVREMGISESTKFNEATQDAMAYHQLKKRGYQKFIDGQITLERFMLSLSQEWASFPVPYRTKGAKRYVNAGETYYAGDGLNKALVSPYEVSSVLQQSRGLA